MPYKETVSKIVSLNWENLSSGDLESLMILSAYSANEFGESLRIALKLFPDSEGLKEMSSGELNTNNLNFSDYNRSGDHAAFLWHFIDKHNLKEKAPKEIVEAGESYINNIQSLSDEVRAMSIFSREEELEHIFEEILKAPNWNTEALSAYGYYLKRHIELDGDEGGHADLLKDFEISEEVDAFYKIRLEMYKSINKLFV